MEEFGRGSSRAQNGFGREVAAADGAFHGGGPAGSGPITGEEKAGSVRGLRGAEAVDAGFWGKRGARFFDDGGFDELGFARGGKRLLNFFQANFDDFFAGFFQQIVRSADDELQILLRAGNRRIGLIRVESGLVKDPLNSGIKKRDEGLAGDWAIEPEMNAGDG